MAVLGYRLFGAPAALLRPVPARFTALLGIVLLAACAAPAPGPLPPTPAEVAAGDAAEATPIPLNLDYSRPGLVDPGSPWGWSFAAPRAAGVEVKVIRGGATGLRFRRPASPSQADPAQTGPAQAIYDLNSPFAGHRLEVAAAVRTPAGSAATIRLGLLVLGADWELVEAWSRPGCHRDCSASITVAEDAVNVQIAIEYAGNGEVYVGPLELAIDGVAGADPVLPGQRPPGSEEIAWVRAHAIPLAATDPGAPDGDLAALEPLIGDAAIVLLGESTHGSREHFTLKHRIVRWLAEEQGFGVLAFEDHAAPARAIDRYLATGEGDPDQLVSGLFGFWARREVAEMLRDLRRSNAAGRGSLAFAGIDLQVPLAAIAGLEAFAAAHDPELGAEIERELGPMRRAWEEGWYPRRSAEEHQRWSAAAMRVERRLERWQARPDADRESLDAELARARDDARLVRQSAAVSASGDWRLRDRFLAENLAALRDRHPPGTRIVVWAHNTHVRLDEEAMGEHLRRRYSGDPDPGVVPVGGMAPSGGMVPIGGMVPSGGMVSIGLFTQRGEYVAYSGSALETYPLFPGPPGSIEYLLHRAGTPVFALDLRRGGDEPGALWMREPRLHRNIGLWPADLGFYRTAIREGFDALLFVDETTATRPLD